MKLEFLLLTLSLVGLSIALQPSELSPSGTKLLLLTAMGDDNLDPTFVTAKQMLTAHGVPFDVVAVVPAKWEGKTSSVTSIVGTPLEDSNGIPLYAGIILTSDQLAWQGSDGGWYSALEWQEWVWLWTWEAHHKVKSVSLFTYPSTQYGVDVAGVGTAASTDIHLTQVAHGYIPSLPVGAALPLEEWHYPAKLCDNCNAACACSAEPWATLDDGTLAAAVRHVTWPGDRDELMFFMIQSQWFSYSAILAQLWINWLTEFAFVGSRRVLLSTQIDDLFLGTEAWDPQTHSDGAISYRMSGADLRFAGQYQERMNKADNSYATEFAFNGKGVTVRGTNNDRLFRKARAMKDKFYFLTHTYTHLDLTVVKYQDPTECLGAAGRIGTPTTYEDAQCELGQNLALADQLYRGTPCGTKFDDKTVQESATCSSWSANSIVTPHISGTHHEPALRAMQEVGIFNMVGDNSKPWLFPFETQPGGWYHGIYTSVPVHGRDGSLIIPRGATNVFYNVWNSEQLVDMYNWIYESYLGLSSLGQIYDREALRVGKDLLDFKPQPHMFHQANLIRFTLNTQEQEPWMEPLGGKVTLLSLWLDAVMNEFKKYSTYPVKTLKQADLAVKVMERMRRDACGASVHLLHQPQATAGETRVSSPVALEVTASNGPCKLGVTGYKGLELYNDQGQIQPAAWNVEDFTTFEATTWIDVPAGDMSTNPLYIPLDARISVLPVVANDVIMVCGVGQHCQSGVPGSSLTIPLMIYHPLVTTAKRTVPDLVFRGYLDTPSGSASIAVDGIVDGNYRAVIPAELTTLYPDQTLAVRVTVELAGVEEAIRNSPVTVSISSIPATAAVSKPESTVEKKAPLQVDESDVFVDDEENQEQLDVKKRFYGDRITEARTKKGPSKAELIALFSAEAVDQAQQVCGEVKHHKEVGKSGMMDACIRALLILNDTRYAWVMPEPQSAAEKPSHLILGEAEMSGQYKNGVPVSNAVASSASPTSPSSSLPFALTAPGLALIVVASVVAGALIVVVSAKLRRRHEAAAIDTAMSRPSLTSPHVEANTLARRGLTETTRRASGLVRPAVQ